MSQSDIQLGLGVHQRLCVGVISIIIAVTAISVQYTGRLYPSVVIGLLICTFIAAGLIFNQEKVNPLVILVVVLGVGIFPRILNILVPYGLLATDPARNAESIRGLLAVGDISGITRDFYSDAPLYHILVSAIRLVSDVNADVSLAVLSVSIVAILVFGVVSIVRIVGPKNTRGELAAGLLAAVSTAAMTYTWRLIPQTAAVMLWICLMILLLRFAQRRQRRIVVLMLPFLLALVYTHKLSAIVSALTIVGMASMVLVTWWGISTPKDNIQSPRSFVWISIIAVVLVFVQLLYVTDYGSVVFVRVTTLLDGVGVATEQPEVYAPDAILVGGGVTGFLSRRLHGITILLAGGVAWLYLLYRSPHKTSGLLGVTAAVVPMIGIGTVSLSTVNPVRVYLMSESALVALIGIAVGFWLKSNRLPRLVPFLFILLLSTQIVSVYTVPDTPESRRQYLTESEYAGLDFSTHIQGEIATDYYYAERASRRPSAGGDWRAVPGAFLTNSLSSLKHEMVAIRPSVETYRFYYEHRGRWRLTYNPVSQLDSELDRVYDSGDSIMYHQ